jgi:hypothetical protein
MRSSFAIAALFVATAGLAGVAQAQEFDLMQFADGNADGKVTPEEYTAFSEQGWGFFSQGADKVKVESLDPMAKPAFADLTPDANGEVSKETYMAAVPGRFKKADKDADGTLTAAELNAIFQPPSS